MPDKLNSQEINEPPDESQDGKEITENLSDFSQNETTFLPHAQRAQLRAAINSVYNTRPYAENLLEPIVSPELPPEEPAPQFEELDIEIKEISEAELLMERAEILIRSGKQEQARQIYSRAVRIAPDNADAWTGLGQLITERNPERARYCFRRALNIDPENEMAIIMLSKVEQRLQPTSQALTRVPEPEARGLQTSSAEGEPNLDIAKKKEIKIGLEEALAVMREKGVEPDPEKVPVGGARLRSAIESGILKPGRIRRHRRLSLPRIALGGLGLSLALLISLALLSGVGLYFVIAQPSFEPVPTPTPAPTSTPAPTATAAPILSPAEIFAGKLRQELERYNRYLTNVKTMVDQQRANKLQWEDFRRNFDDLQKQLKDEKKVVDGLANTVVPQLLTTYKGLQDLAVTMINGTDYMVSGIHNYEPDDLDEALRQFSRASNQIAELANQLNQIIPLPTTTPVVIEPTPEITATTTENIPTLAAPAITITLQATTPAAPTVTTPGTASTTSEPAVTPTPTGTPDSTETPSATTTTGSPAP